MSKVADDVRDQASLLASPRAHADPSTRADAERELLRRLGLAMKAEESSFDAAHGFARIMDATDAHGEVRLGLDGTWRTGASAEEDLLATWNREDRPALGDLLDAIQKTFSSAKIGQLVAEIRPSVLEAP
jgi:hypothetical protein